MTKIRKNILPAMILLFQLFFLYELICNYNVYVLDPSFRSFSEDYWADFSADGAVKLASAVELFFKCIFILSFLYLIMRNPNASWKRIVLAVLAGFVLYGILMLLFRHFSLPALYDADGYGNPFHPPSFSDGAARAVSKKAPVVPSSYPLISIIGPPFFSR